MVQAHGFRSEKITAYRMLPGRKRALLLLSIAIVFYTLLLISSGLHDVYVDSQYNSSIAFDWVHDPKAGYSAEWVKQFEERAASGVLMPPPPPIPKSVTAPSV